MITNPTPCTQTREGERVLITRPDRPDYRAVIVPDSEGPNEGMSLVWVEVKMGDTIWKDIGDADCAPVGKDAEDMAQAMLDPCDSLKTEFENRTPMSCKGQKHSAVVGEPIGDREIKVTFYREGKPIAILHHDEVGFPTDHMLRACVKSLDDGSWKPTFDGERWFDPNNLTATPRSHYMENERFHDVADGGHLHYAVVREIEDGRWLVDVYCRNLALEEVVDASSKVMRIQPPMWAGLKPVDTRITRGDRDKALDLAKGIIEIWDEKGLEDGNE